MIDRDTLKEMIDDIAEQVKWDMSRPMLWGYFFNRGDPKRLREVVPILHQGANWANLRPIPAARAHPLPEHPERTL